MRRSPRRRSLAIGAAACAVGLTLSVVTSVGAVQAIEVGSWWLAPAGGAPPPAHLPEGGVWVASNSAGPSAVSAMRIALLDSESLPVVRLRTASNPTPDLVSITACLTKNPKWRPATAGPWSERPEPDCAAGQVLGVPDTTGEVVQFDLSGMAVGPRVDVTFFPTPAGGSPAPGTLPVVPGGENVQRSFDVTFDAPVPDDVLVRTLAVPEPDAPPVSAPDPGPVSPVPPAEAPAPLEPLEGGSLVGGERTTEPRSVVPSGDPDAAPVEAPGVGSALSPFEPSAASPEGRSVRLVAAAVLAALAGWWWRTAATGSPVPVTLRRRSDGPDSGRVVEVSPLQLRFGTPPSDVVPLR